LAQQVIGTWNTMQFHELRLFLPEMMDLFDEAVD